MNELTDFEKAIDATARLADFVSAYYDGLITRGFSVEQAMTLTEGYQRYILGLRELKK